MEPPIEYLGKRVAVTVDRPLGSIHPKHGFIYEVNYGFISGTVAPDGEELDAYLLGVDHPVVDGEGTCVAIIHRIDDEDDKLVVSVTGKDISNEEIIRSTEFQEKWFKTEIVRNALQE